MIMMNGGLNDGLHMNFTLLCKADVSGLHLRGVDLNRPCSMVLLANSPNPMEIMMKFHTLAATLALTLASATFAQTTQPNTPRVDRREAKQEQRIEQGAASGSLTQKEEKQLDQGQARVATAENKAKADGVVTKKEKARLAHMQNKQNRHIKRQKHDKQSMMPAG
jgi:hypothetical protein